MAENTGENAPLPLAAPCFDLEPSQPGSWLARGWKDYRKAPLVSVLYGLLIAGISWSVSALAYWLGSVEVRLGSLSQRLSASVGQRRLNTDLAGDSAATQSTASPQDMVVA